MPLYAFLLLLAVSLAALPAWHRARRREKARSRLAAEAPGPALSPSSLLSALRGRTAGPAGRLRNALVVVACVLFIYILTRNLLLASLAWPAGIFARRQLEGWRLRKASAKKEEQVLEFIDSISQSLRSGLSLQQALEVSVDDTGEELSGEVMDILRDVRLGSGLGEALTGAAARSASPSLRLAFSVLGLLHGRGGDLPRILERLRKRVAEGLEVRREARILTSQSRASGYLVASLPPVFLLLQAVLNPRSLRPLFATPMGNLIIVAAVALNGAAFLIIRKMLNPEV